MATLFHQQWGSFPLSVCPVYPTPLPPSLSLYPSIPLFLLATACWLKKWAWPQINPSAYLSDPSRGTSPPAAMKTHIGTLLTAADKPTCNTRASWCNPWSHCMNGDVKLIYLNRILMLEWRHTVFVLQHLFFLVDLLSDVTVLSCHRASWRGHNSFYVTFQKFGSKPNSQLDGSVAYVTLTLERGGARMYHLQSTASPTPAFPSFVIWWDSTIPSGPTKSYWQAETHAHAWTHTNMQTCIHMCGLKHAHVDSHKDHARALTHILKTTRGQKIYTEHVVTMQWAAGEPWVPAFMWMALDRNHQPCRPSQPCT